MTTKEAKRNVEQVEEFKERCKTEGERLVNEVFPALVLELNKLYESQEFAPARINDIESDLNIPKPTPPAKQESTANHSSPGAKKRKLETLMNDEYSTPGTKVIVLPNGVAPSNKHIVDLIQRIKPYIRNLIDHSNKVKMWIAYLIPRIEDGNNFGVSIQEDTMAETRQVETDAATYLDQISRYFITRGKIVSKVAKYPHVEDYRRTVKELDEKEYISLRLVVCELRNHYCSLHDMILKNIDKIKKPRNCNTDNMY